MKAISCFVLTLRDHPLAQRENTRPSKVLETVLLSTLCYWCKAKTFQVS